MDEYIQMLDKRRLHRPGLDMREKVSFFYFNFLRRVLNTAIMVPMKILVDFMMRRMLGRDGIHISLTSNS